MTNAILTLANKTLTAINTFDEVMSTKLFKLWIKASQDTTEIYRLKSELHKIYKNNPYLKDMIN